MDPRSRQRWRVAFRRGAAGATIGGRDLQAAVEANLDAAGVPTVGRTQLAVSLASGLAAEHELLDVTLAGRWSVSRVRTVLAAALPPDHRIVDCHDVWLGEPALAAQARGAEYRVELATGTPSGSRLREAAVELLACERIERSRTKGDRAVAYDLRPLLADIEVESDGPPAVLRIEVRIDPERGSGRPEEVIAALAQRCGGMTLEVASVTRTRIILSGDDPRD